jgi:hypothetical protein
MLSKAVVNIIHYGITWSSNSINLYLRSLFFTCIAIQPAVEAARDVSPQLVEAENTMKDLAAERAQIGLARRIAKALSQARHRSTTSLKAQTLWVPAPNAAGISKVLSVPYGNFSFCFHRSRAREIGAKGVASGKIEQVRSIYATYCASP